MQSKQEDTIEVPPRVQALFAAAESVGGQGQTADAATELAAEADPIASEEAGEEGNSSLDSEAELTDEEGQEVDTQGSGPRGPRPRASPSGRNWFLRPGWSDL